MTSTIMRKITIREAKRTFKVAIIGSKGVGKSGEYFHVYFSPWLATRSLKLLARCAWRFVMSASLSICVDGIPA